MELSWNEQQKHIQQRKSHSVDIWWLTAISKRQMRASYSSAKFKSHTLPFLDYCYPKGIYCVLTLAKHMSLSSSIFI